jgi:alcohol dehydrogenase class IV
MPRTSYSFPTTIDFGEGALGSLPEHVRAYGHTVLVVTDPGMAELPVFAQVLAVLDDGDIPYSVLSTISPNPLASECEAGGELFRATGADVIVGVGGGSALDGAKGVALMATHPAPMIAYDDALGGSEKISDDVPPVIAIPTTAGTGSEVGRSTVVVDSSRARKIVVFSPHLMPRVALIDPALMTSMPAGLTAATGFDALTHNLEALTALGYHPMADGIALEGLALVAAHLSRAVQVPDDLAARGGMAMAALMGATAFQKGLGVCHSLAHPLSSLAQMHHGLANAVLLPYVVSFNRDVAGDAYRLVSDRLGCGDLVPWLVALRAELGIPHTLAEAGIDRGLIQALAEQAIDDACHASNPRPCSLGHMVRLYEAAFDGDLEVH